MLMLEHILSASWNLLCLSAPYMLFGFFVAGLLKAFIPDDFIARHLGRDNRSSLLKAALFGVPIPLCSCGVLPAAAGLRKQGAGKGATTAFLISTPETGVDSMAVTWGLLDPFIAVFRPLAAFFSALLTGQLVRMFGSGSSAVATDTTENSGPMSKVAPRSCDRCQENEPAAARQKIGLWARLVAGMKFAFGDLFHDIAAWFFVGIGIAGLISVLVTPELVEQWLGNPFVAMPAMLLAGIPLYVCATASTPIAAALVLKGLSPGAAMVFLLTGPATNAAALSVTSKILGRKATVVYLAGLMLSALIMGLCVDAVYSMADLSSRWQQVSHEDHRTLIGMISALVLFALAVFPQSPSSCGGTSCECR